MTPTPPGELFAQALRGQSEALDSDGSSDHEYLTAASRQIWDLADRAPLRSSRASTLSAESSNTGPRESDFLRKLPILVLADITAGVHAFDVLGDPVRRRIIELLSEGELSAGQVTDVVAAEFGISQPTVSGHLRVLRESGFASVRQEGTRRLYAIEFAPLQEVDRWLEGFRRFWTQPLDALATELARGRRRARLNESDEGEGND